MKTSKVLIATKEELVTKYFIGVDLGFRLKWWQRFLVRLGFRNRWQDYSYSTVWKQLLDGDYELVDINNF